MRRSLPFAFLAAVAIVAWLAGPAKAEPSKANPVKDPVEAAFSLPPGVEMTTERREAVQKVRQKREVELRAALDKLASAKDERTRRVAVNEVTRIRRDIQKELANILGAAPPLAPMGKARGWAYNEAWYPMWHPYYGPVYYPVLEPYWYPDPPVAVPQPVIVPQQPSAPAADSGVPAWRQINRQNRNPAPWQRIPR